MTRVVTKSFEPTAGQELFDLMPIGALSFIRHDDGLVGWGEYRRFTASGPNRIAELAELWRTFVASLEIEDQVNLSGSGPVAFGSIAFADESEATSVLVVPKVVIGRRDERYWLTSIDGAELPTVSPAPINDSVSFGPAEVTRARFAEMVDAAVGKIKAGELEKVVLARDLVAKLPDDFDLRPVLRKLSNTYPSCWIYQVDGMFGASPELLVRVSHGQVSARVLAGTAARGTDPSVDQAIAAALAESHKNVEEHRFAVQSLVAALEPYCDHVDADPKPFSLPLPNLWHLASDVHAVLNSSSSSLDLASALHPTAAVAGTPRESAQKLIAELEPFDRGRYAGPIGWIGADGDGEWVIALRGAQVQGKTIRAFAGCGVVAESEGESEATETDLKFQPIIGALS